MFKFRKSESMQTTDKKIHTHTHTETKRTHSKLRKNESAAWTKCSGKVNNSS